MDVGSSPLGVTSFILYSFLFFAISLIALQHNGLHIGRDLNRHLSGGRR